MLRNDHICHQLSNSRQVKATALQIKEEVPVVSIKVHKAHKVQVDLDKVAAYRNSTDHRTKVARVDSDRRHRTVSIKDRVASAKAVAHLNNTELLLRARLDKTEPHRHNMVHHNPPAPVFLFWFR